MSIKTITIDLLNPGYVAVMKDGISSYGGSQMWFPDKGRFSKDYVLRTYGCGSIATADLLLYLAIQNEAMQTGLTSVVLQDETGVKYENYDLYVRQIDKCYTHTRHIIAVLGPKVASAINTYSEDFDLGLKAAWRWKLSYYDMLDIIEEMLALDIPIILSIGPNWPNLWGKKGISFYERKEIDFPDIDSSFLKVKPYYYHAVQQGINGHYVVITGIVKDEIAGRIMLCISSWGKKYYINYEEYRDYIDTLSTTWLSSLVQIKK